MALSESEIQHIEKTIADSIQLQLGSYKIDKEQHYQDHIWLKEWREWQQAINSTMWKSIVKFAMLIIFGLLMLGFIFWGGKNFK